MNDHTQGIPTGSIQLDEILGGSGLPDGTIAELFGEQGTGKSTLALELIQSVQERNGSTAYIDAEHSLDVDYAKNIGIRPDALLFAQPDTGDEALDIVRELIDTERLDLVVVDSAAALVPGQELERNFDEETSHELAELLSNALRKISPTVKQSGTVLCFTNQVRSRLNRPAGPDETTPGGNALKFYSSVRINLEQVSPIEKRDRTIGRRIRVHVVKNRSAPPDQSAEVDLLFDRGICPFGDLLDAGLDHGIVEQRSGEYVAENTSLGRNRHQVRSTLEQDPSLTTLLRERVEASEDGG